MAPRQAQVTARQAASRQYLLEFLTEYANAVLDLSTGELLEYRHLIQNPKYAREWKLSSGNEIRRLAQGIGDRVKGTNTIFFVNKKELPQDCFKDVTYGKFVCMCRKNKEETDRTQLAVGGNHMNYTDDCGTPPTVLLMVKPLLNSIVSTTGAEFMTIDIKNFYLKTPLKRYEYFRLRIADLPDDVIEQYKLREKATKEGFVYVEIQRGIYGMPHSGLIAQELLEKRLEKHGYQQSKLTPGFWKHKWRPISFSLVVDDFGVKYVGKQHVMHLIQALKEHYKISQDWTGSKYCGLELDWDYKQREVHLLMPGYVANALLTTFQSQGRIKETISATPTHGTSVWSKCTTGYWMKLKS